MPSLGPRKSTMAPSTSRTARYNKSLSSLLTWSRRRSFQTIDPIIFEDDDVKLATERRREIQLTLDKLEGRLTVSSDGKLQRASSKSSNELCGVMSMLAQGPIGSASILSEASQNDGPYGEPNTAQAIPGYAEEGKLTNTIQNDHPRTYCPYRGRCILRGVDRYDLGLDGVTDGHDDQRHGDKYITHPAFNSLPRGNKAWDTTSRISDDSLFDEHDRQNLIEPNPREITIPTFSCGRADHFLLSADRPWPYPEFQISQYPTHIEPTSFGGDIKTRDDFFAPSVVDCGQVIAESDSTITQHSQHVNSITPMLLNTGSTPLRIAGVQPKSTFAKRILSVFIKPLKIIGNFAHRAPASHSTGNV